MRPSLSLPSSNFRIAALAVLATITIGATFVDIDVASNPASAEPAATGSAVEATPSTLVTIAPTVSTLPATSQAASSTEVAAPQGDSAPVTTAAETVNDSNDVIGAGLAPGSPVVFDFAEGSVDWKPLAGDWSVEDEQYVQNDGNGFDYISQVGIELPDEYSVSVEMTALDTPLGGGLVVGQPVQGSRRGATLIDFTNDGMFLRWGDYDAGTGGHQYRGGLAMSSEFDPLVMHVLTIEVRPTRTKVLIDGEPIGDFAPVAPGFPGLASSESAVAFDNFTIAQL